jgi:Trk K+ transport system NAD-binding subunit
MVIIGLGRAGCNIAKAFSKFPQYKTYSIDADKDADITIKKRNSHEDYDAHFPSLKRRLKLDDNNIIVAVAGSGHISGALLRLLEQLKDNKITVLYVQPDLELASEIQKMQEKVVRNVLQEYARSGMIEMLWMVDNQLVEKGIGDVPIMGYYDVLNQAIVNTVHMINIFRNSEPVIGNFVTPSHLSRIAAIGILDVEKEEEKWFFDLTRPRDVVYYYGINETELKEDGTLFKKITNYVKSQVATGVNVSYGVFTTTYEQKYCYCIKYSSMVQSFLEQLDDQDIS